MQSPKSNAPASVWRREAHRSLRLAIDLGLRLFFSFGIAIGYGLFELKIRHHGTPESMASLCGTTAIGIVLLSLVIRPPAYFNFFSAGADKDAD